MGTVNTGPATQRLPNLLPASAFKTVIFSAMIFIGSSVAAPAAGTRSVEGVPYPEAHRRGSVSLELKSLAAFRYKKWIKVYTAGLYLPSDVPPARALEDVPKRLELQ